MFVCTKKYSITTDTKFAFSSPLRFSTLSFLLFLSLGHLTLSVTLFSGQINNVSYLSKLLFPIAPHSASSFELLISSCEVPPAQKQRRSRIKFITRQFTRLGERMHRSFVSQKQHGKCQGKCSLFLRIQKKIKNHNKAVAVQNEREATCYSSACYFIYCSYASRPTCKGSQGQLVDSWCL